jgi:hypothetical protein
MGVVYQQQPSRIMSFLPGYGYKQHRDKKRRIELGFTRQRGIQCGIQGEHKIAGLHTP